MNFIRRFGTPLYVYEADVVRTRCRELRNHFNGAHIYYAIKANNNPHVLRLIKKEGIGVEAVSPGELALAKAAGFPKSRISFTGTNLTEEELRYAATYAHVVHLDSLEQLRIWGREKLGKTVSLRLNLDIGAGHHAHAVTGGTESKFGITRENLAEAQHIAATHGLRIIGLQQHVGSHILEVEPFMAAMEALLKAAEVFEEVTNIDFGGGLGVPYKPTEKRLNLKALGKEYRAVTQAFSKKTGRELSYALEPGRYIIAEAGTLYVTVTDVKKTRTHTFVGVNSGMNHLIRHALYGSYHQVENTSRKGKREKVTVVGNICESGDGLARDQEIVLPQIGDTLAIRTAGAYGMTMASFYNLRALPKEVLVAKGRAKDITFPREAFLSKHSG